MHRRAHAHEHFKAEKIGKTLCVNAGFGTHVNVVMDVKGKKVAALNFLKDGKRVSDSVRAHSPVYL